MNASKEKEISKKLSYVLRHRPDSIGIQLDSMGWTDVDLLLEKLHISIEELEYVVVNNKKKRFDLSDDKLRIRANQGHSVEVYLDLVPQTPPKVLYHGTATRFLDSIARTGLQKMNRHHVHLSSDIETAKQVGMRHGKLHVLLINSGAMSETGILFYKTKNNVWLTDSVDVQYISNWEE